MAEGSIQLPFGYVPDDNKKGDLQFKLLLNFRRNILFDKLPYIAHLDNPTINNVIKGGKVDELALQKYLLATGLMQDTIQENLNMKVTDGSFNNASIRRTLDTKYPSMMKKSNPIDAVFKDKTKFDVQNPIVGSLIAQVQENQARERAYMKQLSQAPSITDINIGNRLKKLRDFNDENINDDRNNNNVDDDDGPGVLPTPPQSFRLPSPPRDELPERDLNEAQRFLLQGAQPENANVSEPARQQQIAIAAIPRRVTFSDNAKRIFPEVKKILVVTNTEPDVDLEAETHRLEVRAIAEEILRRKLEDVQFFSGDSGGEVLFARARSIVG